jgi:NAD(P)-dependent dehydrogenase (short-subunit alcohol dehydrogenase family)
VSMTLPLARDLGKYGVRVMSIAPSAFSSPMTEHTSSKVRDGLLRDLAFPAR